MTPKIQQIQSFQISENFLPRAQVLEDHICGTEILVQAPALPEGDSDINPEPVGIGIIGTRRPSPYGIHFVNCFVDHLAFYLRKFALPSPVIISGGALGIDGAAHAAALKGSLPTWAWLVGPLQSPSPRVHSGLFRQISQTPGCALLVPKSLEPSLRAEKGAPFKSDWIDRNAWLAASCEALIVVEAQEKSGTWATVRMANKIGIPVFALPGSVFSNHSRGTNSMISNGYAHPILSVEKLVEALVVELW